MLPVLALVAALLLVGCSPGSDDGPGAADDTTTSTDAGSDRLPPPPQGQGEIPPGAELALSDPPPEVLERVASLPGRLAIGEGPALVLARPDGSDLLWLDDGESIVASQPTWSHDGAQLAWSRVTDDRVEVVVAGTATIGTGNGAGSDPDPGTGDPATGDPATGDLGPADLALTDLTVTPAFYFQWAPTDDTLVFLRNDPNLAGLELGLVDPGSPAQRLGAAAPLFVSWAPSAPMLAIHIAQRQVIVIPVPSGAGGGLAEPVLALDGSGPFSVPAWIDDATLLVAADDGLVTLDMETLARTPVVDTGGERVQFVLSPDRRRVAFALPDPDGAGASPVALAQDQVAGGLQVVELATGEISAVTDQLPGAFEWSPDSSRLAWLELESGPVPARARWSFWDGTDSTPSVPFAPSRVVQEVYFPFFEQYAQSVTAWSPDSSAFAFAGRPDGADSVPGGSRDSIWVQLVDTPGAPPVRVAGGDVVVWGPADS